MLTSTADKPRTRRADCKQVAIYCPFDAWVITQVSGVALAPVDEKDAMTQAPGDRARPRERRRRVPGRSHYQNRRGSAGALRPCRSVYRPECAGQVAVGDRGSEQRRAARRCLSGVVVSADLLRVRAIRAA